MCKNNGFYIGQKTALLNKTKRDCFYVSNTYFSFESLFHASDLPCKHQTKVIVRNTNF